MGHHIFRIATRLAVTRCFGAQANCFHALQTKLAGATGPEHPRHADAISNIEIFHACAQLFNMPGNLVAGYQGQCRVRRPIAFNRVKIAMANTAGLDFDQYFAGAGLRPRYGFNCKSSADLAKYGGLHCLGQDCTSSQLCGKTFRCGHVPGLAHVGWCGAIKQFAGLHAMIKFLETDGAVGSGPLHEVGWA